MNKFKKKMMSALAMTAVMLLFSGLFTDTALAAKETESSPVFRMMPGNFRKLSENLSPAVVNIRTEKTVRTRGMQSFGENGHFENFFSPFFGNRSPKNFRQKSLGTGFIIDRQGYIVTNNHVVDGADEIKVALKNKKEYAAEIVGRDPQTDIALIRVKTDEKLPVAPLGSSEKLAVGDWVVAIGNPFGLEHTVTAGIVSAKGRVIGSGPYDDFIQTDASINPGNSGGPLINMNGEVVGINTMIITGGQGIGFAIPIDMARNVIAQLKSGGEVTRGWLGLTIQDLKGDLGNYYGRESGVLVTETVAGDPADRAGIRPRDIITEINGKKISDTRELTRMVAALPVGRKAEITVLRKGSRKNFQVSIGKRPAELADSRNPAEKESRFGLQFADIRPEMAEKYGLSADSGVIVTGIRPGSKAEESGIRKGDIIVEMNRQEVESADRLQKEMARIGKKEKISLLVRRGKNGLLLIDLS